jgi:hypothetical protein
MLVGVVSGQRLPQKQLTHITAAQNAVYKAAVIKYEAEAQCCSAARK